MNSFDNEDYHKNICDERKANGIKPIVRTGGWAMERKPYSTSAKEEAIQYIQRLRTGIELPTTDAMEGSRFNDDESVFLRLESNYQEAEFRQFPMESVAGALIACAQADWWYAKEKDWGNDADDCDADNDMDYAEE